MIHDDVLINLTGSKASEIENGIRFSQVIVKALGIAAKKQGSSALLGATLSHAKFPNTYFNLYETRPTSRSIEGLSVIYLAEEVFVEDKLLQQITAAGVAPMGSAT